MLWRPVAVVPDRDTLFVTGSEDEEGLTGPAILVEQQLKEANRHISAQPLVLTEDGWQQFEPPPNVRNFFALGARLLGAEYWKDFKDAQEKELSARGQDIFVASLSVYTENNTGAAAGVRAQRGRTLASRIVQPGARLAYRPRCRSKNLTITS
jgi:hypothetical protein